MHFKIKEKNYKVLEDYRNGFKEESVLLRWNDILDKYDYVIGDWGYEQLRLKGFYEKNHHDVTNESNIDYIRDYIDIYCNFNCPYFIIKKEYK